MENLQPLPIRASNGIQYSFIGPHRFNFYGEEEINPAIQRGSGLYAVLNVVGNKEKNYEIFYIGEAEDILERIERHDRKEDWKEYHNEKNGDAIEIFVMYTDPREIELRKHIEQFLIHEQQPALNVQGRR